MEQEKRTPPRTEQEQKERVLDTVKGLTQEQQTIALAFIRGMEAAAKMQTEKSA